MSEFIKVASTSDLAPGEKMLVEYQGRPVGLFNIDGEFFAIHDPTEQNLAKVDELMDDAGFTKDGDGFWIDGDGLLNVVLKIFFGASFTQARTKNLSCGHFKVSD